VSKVDAAVKQLAHGYDGHSDAPYFPAGHS